MPLQNYSAVHQVEAMRPNFSLKLTRYGQCFKAGQRHMMHHRSLGLRHLPTPAT